MSIYYRPYYRHGSNNPCGVTTLLLPGLSLRDTLRTRLTETARVFLPVSLSPGISCGVVPQHKDLSHKYKHIKIMSVLLFV